MARYYSKKCYSKSYGKSRSYRSYRKKHYKGKYKKHYKKHYKKKHQKCPAGSVRVGGKCRIYPSKKVLDEIKSWPTARRAKKSKKGCKCHSSSSSKKDAAAIAKHYKVPDKTTAADASDVAAEVSNAIDIAAEATTNPVGAATRAVKGELRDIRRMMRHKSQKHARAKAVDSARYL